MGANKQITHMFYQDSVPGVVGECDYSTPDGERCALTAAVHPQGVAPKDGKWYRILTPFGEIISDTKGNFAGWRPGKIFGRLDCASGMKMKPENRVFFDSFAAAIQCGYQPCKKCKPSPPTRGGPRVVVRQEWPREPTQQEAGTSPNETASKKSEEQS